jgi:hypothetical protein
MSERKYLAEGEISTNNTNSRISKSFKRFKDTKLMQKLLPTQFSLDINSPEEWTQPFQSAGGKL